MDMKIPFDTGMAMRPKDSTTDTGQIEKQAHDGRLREACQGFEEIFINMMLKEMRKAMPKGGLFPDTLQKDIYTSLFDQQIAKDISTGRGVGISDMLYENLSGKLKT